MTDCRTHKNWPLIVLAEYEDSTIGGHLSPFGRVWNFKNYYHNHILSHIKIFWYFHTITTSRS